MGFLAKAQLANAAYKTGKHFLKDTGSFYQSMKDGAANMFAKLTQFAPVQQQQPVYASVNRNTMR